MAPSGTGDTLTSGGPDAGDQIQLRGLRVIGTHGVLPEEKSRAQPFEIDLDLSVDLTRAGATDRLLDTVDYAGVAGAAAAIVSGPTSFELVVEVAVDPEVNPYRLLEQCHRLEAAAGRVRTVRWGPRTLDADVLWIDGVVLDDPSLTIPHPRWRQRRFVMAPLGELAPDLADDEAIATAGGEVTVVGTL